MKTSTKIFLAVLAIGGAWGFYQDKFRGEENDMELLHAKVEMHRMECTKTESLYDRTWMTCRYPDSEDKNMGSVWVLQEDEQGPVWISRNGSGMRVVDRYTQLPNDVKSQVPRVHRASLEENNAYGLNSIPSVPWEELN